MYLFDACPKLYFGPDALDCLLELPTQKTLLVTDPFMVKSGTVHTVTDRLDRRGIAYTIFSDIQPDPSVETVAAGLRQLLLDKPEIVIALGGGSAIDTAKAMLFFCSKLQEGFAGGQSVHRPQFIAVPTTSGTGSEVTSYAVVSDRQREVKIPLNDRSMVPDAAILDPGYTKTLPADMIAFTGMDVLTHAVEAYVNPHHNDLTDLCARDAAHKVLHYLPGLYNDTSDPVVREKMFTASTLAGLAFTNAGLGLGHGMAHTVGAEFHLPHGKANAVILPYIIAYNAGLGSYRREEEVVQKTRERYACLARDIGVAGDGTTESCRRLVAVVQVLAEQMGIPHSLEGCGVSKADFNERRDRAANKIMQDICTLDNPTPVDKDNVYRLLGDLYWGNLTY